MRQKVEKRTCLEDKEHRVDEKKVKKGGKLQIYLKLYQCERHYHFMISCFSSRLIILQSKHAEHTEHT